MCWSTEKFLNRIPRIALKDIHVKKVMNFNPNTGKFVSFYAEHEYESGVVNKCVKIKPVERITSRFFIECGYHSYSCKCKFERIMSDRNYIYAYCKNNHKKIIGTCWDVETKTTGIGIETYYPICKPICLVDCIIPKGTIYYENEKGEIVSQRIIINGKEEI